MSALLRCLGVLGLALFSSLAQAQGFPSKPISMIVTWPAGGSSDLHMRAFAEIASKHLGQPIIVENKPGAGGTLGPKGMDPAVVKVLHDAFKKALYDPEHIKVLDRYDQPLVYLNAEDHTKWAEKTFREERALIERLGLLAK